MRSPGRMAPHVLIALVVAAAACLSAIPLTTTPARSAPGDAVLVGAGDISTCTNNNDEATAVLLDGIAGTVYTLGDNVYDSGTEAEFDNCYDPTWGRHKGRTRPVSGNHEYETADAAPYYAYFGPSAGDPTKGYYSYDAGSFWHVIVLNSECAADRRLPRRITTGDVAAPGSCGEPIEERRGDDSQAALQLQLARQRRHLRAALCGAVRLRRRTRTRRPRTPLRTVRAADVRRASPTRRTAYDRSSSAPAAGATPALSRSLPTAKCETARTTAC